MTTYRCVFSLLAMKNSSPTISLAHFRMFAVPVCVLLEDARCANDGGVVARFRYELQSDGKVLVGEPAGNGKSRE